MKINGLFKSVVIILLSTLIVACGGGGSSAGSNSTYTGAITGFGSIFVNGVEFDTSGASIRIDDKSGTESDLKVGMQVTISGQENGSTGTASNVTFSDDLEGIVISNAIVSGQATGDMNIMGQTVTITDTTIMESKVAGVVTPDQITMGMIVEVSGSSSGTGSITATRIEVKASDLATYLAAHTEGIELKGIVKNHVAGSFQFDVGGMTIDYAGAKLDNMPAGSYNGLYVEVKSIQGLDQSNNLVASKVELENNGIKGSQGSDKHELEVHGLISKDIAGDNTFSVNGQVFKVDTNTRYRGISKGALLTGVMVKVEAYFMNGVLIARKVKKENTSSGLKIKGNVATVTTSGTNTGTVTMQDGTVIIVDSNTIMKDSRNNGVVPNPHFNLQGLSQGDYVKIDYINNGGTLVAIKLEREN